MEEKSLLIEYLGDSPRLRIIDFLIENRLFDYSKKQITEGAGISKLTFYKYWEGLEKAGIVNVTRSFGKAKLYQLNQQNPVVKKLMEIEWLLIEQSVPGKAKLTVHVSKESKIRRKS